MNRLIQLRSGRAFPVATKNDEVNEMEGYQALRNRIDRFMKDNPDVQFVTLKRPTRKPKRTYLNGNAECYGRMPESCPIVKGILASLIPDGLKIIHPDGTEASVSEFRDEIFQHIHNEVTAKFRAALSEVCDQKYLLLNHLRDYHGKIREQVREAETEIVELETEAPRVRSRRERSTEVEFEIGEEDDGWS